MFCGVPHYRQQNYADEANRNAPRIRSSLIEKGLDSLSDPISENFDLIGASLVTIQDSDNFDLEHLYLNERANGDFIRWEKW